MTEKLRRRDVLKTVSAAAGGLLLLGGAASAAEPERSKKLAGGWLNNGKLDQPCAIFAEGRVLLLVNEKGDLAVGYITGANKFAVVKGGWGAGVEGELAEGNETINWKEGGTWKRP
jgi:hypothetical protein